MKKTKLSIVLATLVATSSLMAASVDFSTIEKKISQHAVYQNIKKLGFKVNKVYEDQDGLYTVTGEIPARTLPNGKKVRAQKVVTFLTNDGKYMIFGDILKQNGQKVEVPVEPVDVSILKDKEAFSIGNGKEELYVFSDPDCPGCINLFNRIGSDVMKKYKIHYFMFPLEHIHKEAKQKSLYILSQPKDKRMQTYQLIEGKNTKIDYNGKDTNITKEAIAELKESKDLARKVNLTHTPFILNSKGEMIRGIQ